MHRIQHVRHKSFVSLTYLLRDGRCEFQNSTTKCSHHTFFHSLLGALLLSAAFFVCTGEVVAASLFGEVVGVTDGDSITILDDHKSQHKIRLAGIDAPEKRQPFGDRSKQNLAKMIFRKNVSVVWNKHDRYGRVVGKVLFNGRDVNLEQVSAGLAWHYKDYESEQLLVDRKLYADAEHLARFHRLGLWQEQTPDSPWDFRRSRRHR